MEDLRRCRNYFIDLSISRAATINDMEGFMRHLILVPLFCAQLVSMSAFAQKEDLNARDPRLSEGSLFTVKFTPGAKRVEISLAGERAVLLGPTRVEVFGRDLSSGKVRRLTVKPVEDHFEILDQLRSPALLEIDVHDKADDKRETFKFNMRDRP
jgi:hypothetical protein